MRLTKFLVLVHLLVVFLGRGPGLEPRLDPPHPGHISGWSSKVLTRFTFPICDTYTALHVVTQCHLGIILNILHRRLFQIISYYKPSGGAGPRAFPFSVAAWVSCSVSQQFQNAKGVREQRMGPDAGNKAAPSQKRKEGVEGTRHVPKTADVLVHGKESGLDVKIVDTLSTRPNEVFLPDAATMNSCVKHGRSGETGPVPQSTRWSAPTESCPQDHTVGSWGLWSRKVKVEKRAVWAWGWGVQRQDQIELWSGPSSVTSQLTVFKALSQIATEAGKRCLNLFIQHCNGCVWNWGLWDWRSEPGRVCLVIAQDAGLRVLLDTGRWPSVRDHGLLVLG